MRGMTRSSTIWEVDARQPRQTLTHSQSGFWFSRGRCCWAPSCPGPQRRKRLHRLKICDHPRRAPLQDSPAINPHWWFQFFGEYTVKKELAGTTGCSGSYYLWDVLHNYCFRRLAVLVQDLKFLPKVTKQLSENKSSVLFLCFVCSNLFSQIFDIFPSPTQSFGVGYDKLDSACVTEITKMLLIVQGGVREDHHLETEDKSTSRKTTGNYSGMWRTSLSPEPTWNCRSRSSSSGPVCADTRTRGFKSRSCCMQHLARFWPRWDSFRKNWNEREVISVDCVNTLEAFKIFSMSISSGSWSITLWTEQPGPSE